MSTTTSEIRLSSIVVLISLTVTSMLVLAVQEGSVEFLGISSVALSAIICFSIQWIGWIPGSILQTERFYDITGGLTYVVLALFTLWMGSSNEGPGLREILVTGFVIVWAIRLSSFLFLRIHHKGRDGRFDELKTSPVRFLVPWTLQGLWVFITMNVVIVINSQSGDSVALGFWDVAGSVLWLTGFSIEVVADSQKSAFNKKEANEGKWIEEGLWSYSRHPNYLGEIILWTGIALFGVPCFRGWEFFAWISPIFVFLLLTKLSGVPILDRRAMEKWGENQEYLDYRRRTPEIFPIIGRRS